MARILIVDDDPNVLLTLRILLEKEGGHAVTTFEYPAEALEQLPRGGYELCISDVSMPGMDGLELLARARASAPEVEFIMMSAGGTIDMAVEAMRRGALDFLTKPYNAGDAHNRVERALEARRLRTENRLLRTRLLEEGRYRGLIGTSPSMREIYSIIERVAQTPASVLITGESGTGKEMVARAVHAAGPHAERLFIPVDCSAISHGVIESELFGHVKGAFTGAAQSREGLLKAAADGTVFLDEIGELPLELQAKLLRALQEREFRPVGSTCTEAMRARVIAATHADLAGRVREGSFREDLYYRLNVVNIEVPALRDRPEDIPILAARFLDEFDRGSGRVRGFTDEALAMLRRYRWPGNVRELRNYIERAFALGADGEIGPTDLPIGVRTGEVVPTDGGPADANATPPSLAEVEQEAVQRTLAWAEGNKRKAARVLGISIATLYRKITTYDLS